MPNPVNQQYQVNSFFGGVDKDTDAALIPDTKLRSALNIRLINIEGQGFVATNIGGNEQAFTLSAGFIPLGYCEYNGIAYIFSYNTITNFGEVGVYPSPFRLPNNDCVPNGGFEHVYKPLNNFTGTLNPLLFPNAPRLNFSTLLFNFDCEHQIECFARTDYDNTVNLYFTDFKNPIRSINSGFNQEGICNNRKYFDGSFPNAVELLAETCAQPIVDSILLNENGCHKAGNWFYFIRYNTISFNPTSFLGESNAVEMYADALSAGIIIDGNDSATITNKSITLNLSNLDTTYPYLEVAFVRHFDGTFETGLFDKQFLINPSSSTLQINITGCEQVLDMTFENIILRKSSSDIVKSICQLENRLWGANVKDRILFHEDLLAFANAVVGVPNDTLQINDAPFNGPPPFTTPVAMPPFGQYKDYQKTYDQTGYFRSESYAYAIIFISKSGRETEPLPITGYDYWYDPFATQANTEGIVRFPSCSASPLQSPLQQAAGFLNIMGIEFNVAACIFTPWMQDNICGFYFTRSERNKNLLYQGLGTNTYTSWAQLYIDIRSRVNPCNVVGDDQELVCTNSIPLVQGGQYVPYVAYCDPVGANSVECEGNAPAVAKPNKFGLFSPDHFFKKSIVDSSYVIFKMGTFSFNLINPSFQYQPGKLFDVTSITAIPEEREIAATSNIQEWQPSANNGFVSLYNEPVSETDPTAFYYYKIVDIFNHSWKVVNRAFATTRYIGIDNTNTANPGIGTYDNALLNIFSKDPDPSNGFVLTDEYDIKNTKYYKVSDFIDINNYQAIVTGTIYYKGDCFLQRTYLKTVYNPDVYPITQLDDYNVFFTHGVMASIVCEGEYNTAMRFSTASNKYYPNLGLYDINLFISNDIKRESDSFNTGYNQVLSINGIFGYNSSLPFDTIHFPTRVIYSNMHTPNAFSDGYRVVNLAAYRDYDFRMGPINKITDFNSLLVIVQDKGLSVLYQNERAAISMGASAGELLIGNGEVLSPKTKNISDTYGSQHQWSIVKTDNGIYGVDAIRRKIWRFSTQGFDLLSDSKSYRSETHDILNQGSDHSDIIHTIPDNPICRGGILAGFDKKFNDIVWNFMFNQTVENPMINYTVRYNEWIDAFTDKYNNGTPFNLSINNDYFTFNPNIFPSQQVNYSVSGDCWLENIDINQFGLDNKVTFYGVTFPFMLSYYVNKYNDYTKIFDNFIIVAGPDDPYSISYSTIFQFNLQLPFIQSQLTRQLIPHYRENRWKGPVGRAQVITNNTNNIYAVNSPMRGIWMKTDLQYLTNKPIFVKSVQTDFRISKQ